MQHGIALTRKVLCCDPCLTRGEESEVKEQRHFIGSQEQREYIFWVFQFFKTYYYLCVCVHTCNPSHVCCLGMWRSEDIFRGVVSFLHLVLRQSCFYHADVYSRLVGPWARSRCLPHTHIWPLHRLGLNTHVRLAQPEPLTGQATSLAGPGILFFKRDVQSPGHFLLKNQLLYTRCFLSFVMRGSRTSWICWLINSPGISQRVELSCPIFLCLEHKPCYYQPHPVPRRKRTASLSLPVRKQSHATLQKTIPPTHQVWKKRLWDVVNSLTLSHYYWNANSS